MLLIRIRDTRPNNIPMFPELFGSINIGGYGYWLGARMSALPTCCASTDQACGSTVRVRFAWLAAVMIAPPARHGSQPAATFVFEAQTS